MCQGGHGSIRTFFKMGYVIECLFPDRKFSVATEVDDTRDEGIGCKSKILQRVKKTGVIVF